MINLPVKPVVAALAVLATLASVSFADEALDRKVKAFLESRRGRWHDLNVPVADGKILYDLVIANKATRALEIGTSTGHSGIWIAWALSRTGGKLVTVEIDPERHEQAVANFREAGLSDFVDARLGDAHTLVPSLEGPFDFVFCDADKGWYKNYLIAVMPKLTVGGLFVAHNVSERRRSGWGTGEFLGYVLGLPDMETTFPSGSSAGISVSRKIDPGK